MLIETTLKSYVGDGTPLDPDEAVAFNYEQNGTIEIKVAKVLDILIFGKKYNMQSLIQKMKADHKFKAEFFEANPDYSGKELYENRTALEQPVYSDFRGFPGCIE